MFCYLPDHTEFNLETVVKHPTSYIITENDTGLNSGTEFGFILTPGLT